MISQLSWKIGGQQGEGIDSTGEIFAITLNRQGYYLYGYRHFSSRIKGGHTSSKIRVSTKPVHAISDHTDLLIAFDQETIDLDALELRKGGIIIADEKLSLQVLEKSDVRLFSIPFTQLAKELGSPLMKNMIAVGATCAVLGLPIKIFTDVVKEIFATKGQEIIVKDIAAIEMGAAYFNQEVGKMDAALHLLPADGKQRMFMVGNDAMALGALASGVRFMSAYPITPASEVMEYLIRKLPPLGGTVLQTEDEIAAVLMSIGANYGGARALTASSGPGLSLMMEGIGLAGITEIPLVIINSQRGGPSTGLPTKQEQSDLNAMLYGTHGEIPKVVLMPSTVEEAFYDIMEAFNIAEEYQVPVILLSDLQLSLGKQTVEPLDFRRVAIRRGKLIKEDQPEGETREFKRYAFTEDGVSPRVIPGVKNGIHHVTGVEHNQVGKPSEDPINRRQMMDKRLNKLNHFRMNNAVLKKEKEEQADAVIVGMGSNRGAIEEAVAHLEQDGLSVHTLHIRQLCPFPTEEVKVSLEKAKKIIVVENNATGQLANQIKLHIGMHDKINSVLQYDGNPFLPLAVYNKCKELL